MSEQPIFDPVRALVNKIRQNRGLSAIESVNETADKCPVCGGTGWEWLGFDRDLYSWVKACSCSAVDNAKRRIVQSGLSELLVSYTFDSFRTHEPYQKEIVRMAAAYVAAVTSPSQANKPWFYIGGQPGCGKTHICTAVCGKLLDSGFDVVYMVWTTEARRLKSLVNDPSFDSAILPYIGATILYIDDLFKQGPGVKPSDADIRIAFEILNARTNQNKATIISSERMINELIELDEGTISRVIQRAKGYTLSIARDQKKNFRLGA